MSNIILEMNNITKEFPGVKALDRVNFKVEKGQIHALVGENGAGKSTLMKVLSGVHPYGTYDGDIVFEGETCRFEEINQSEAKGIVIIHQELALIPELSVAENVFLGNERAKKGIINWGETTAETEKLIKKVGMRANSTELIQNIGVGQQQLVEIAKALSKRVKLLILDEPTAALNEAESENLLRLLLEFKKEGLTSILISHKLKEVLKVSDHVTVLRDGQTIETLVNDDTLKEDRIISSMVGRSLANLFPERHATIGDIQLEVKDWTVEHAHLPGKKIANNVNFHVKKGEVLGIAGLMGAGRTELMMSIFGQSYGKVKSGQVLKNNHVIDVSTVDKAIKQGLSYVSEDRKEYGLILDDTIKKNVTLANLTTLAKGMTIDEGKEVNVVEDYRNKLKIKAPSIEQNVVNLSGGNQQKVVLGKWMFTNPDILILDEPTRGIDVGAKNEIYKIMNTLAEEGKSIIVISSELPELLGTCDRIYTLNNGHITGDFMVDEADQEKLMTYMTADGSGKK
ncbi:multiple monosaccharide ABC transporter ATP-binding protein [Halolactibacillus sp. JCM 19043]|uniref:multiple monosaccharide ABC transporter ATP-binding protein n=1 Tax=Halolactibacillus sp. JCM 19043 TaxID=1460638 RepID=UPI0007810481|nr:multiple monosaccharide ABC transporter ATP-binding protein [Halolactibacillus sp. JCM 19043]